MTEAAAPATETPEADAVSDRAGVTTAVIVAAGLGSRLASEGGVPKPLRPLMGIPLVARVMATGARAGIERFVVVVGYQAERMREALPRLLPAGCSLDIVENPRFEQPNGVSLQAALGAVREPFALLMSDHVFTEDRLRAARDSFERTGRPLLVVESASTFDGDLADATCVATRHGQVASIGKELARFDAVDTGMFILDPDSLEQAFARVGPAPSISEVMGALAEVGLLDAFDPGVGDWQDVDTAEDLREAERVVLAGLRKPTDGLLARLINRRVSLCVTRRVWRVGVTPNMATAFTLVLGLVAGTAFAQGAGVGWGLLGATLFQLQSILDGVDGELARLLHRESRFGFWFDVGADNLTHIAVFAGIARGQAVSDAPGPWLLLGTAAACGVLASFLAAAPLLPGRPGSHRPEVPARFLARLVSSLTRRDFTYLLFPCAVFGWLGAFLWAAAAGTWLFAAATLAARAGMRTS